MKGKASRDRILDAAAEEFAEAGLAGARVDSIARRAGVNKAMLYYRVGGKSDLYREVFLRAQEELHRGLSAAVSETRGAGESLKAYVTQFMDFAAGHPEMPSIMLREIAGGFETVPDETLAGLRAILGLLGGILEAGRKEGVLVDADPCAVQLMVAAAAVAAARGDSLMGRLKVEERNVPGELAHILLRGLERRPEDV